MGKHRPSYEYPQVHPPHPQAQYQAELQIETGNNSNHRYSYVNTPIEQRGGQSSSMANAQSAPPLPAVPEHLNHVPQVSQQQVIQSRPPTRAQTPAEQMFHQYQELARQQEGIEQQRAPTPQRNNAYALQFQIPKTQTPQPTYYSQRSYTPQATHVRQSSHETQPCFTPQSATIPVVQHQQYMSHTPQSACTPVPQYYQQVPFQTQTTYMPQQPEPVKIAPDHPNYRGPATSNQKDFQSTASTDQKVTVLNHTSNVLRKLPTASKTGLTDYAPKPQATVGGTWAHDLYSCSEPTTCLTGLLCPCVLYGRIQHRLHLRSEGQDPTNMLGHSFCNGACVAWTIACGINGILSGIQKSRVRRSYDMDSRSGNIFSDCLKGCCCCCCTLAQSEKEIKLREEVCRKAVNSTGYVPPIAMSFNPPTS